MTYLENLSYTCFTVDTHCVYTVNFIFSFLENIYLVLLNM